MVFTDTHTHLYSSKFDNDRDEVIKNCIDKGINRLFMPNIDSSYIDKMMNLAKKYPQNCFPMMGLHPTAIKKNYTQELAIVEEWLTKFNFCAIGEIGIDLYWDKTFLPEQQEAFQIQIKLAKKYNIPFVIHCRNAFNEVFEILDELNDDKMKGLFHCFTGNIQQAKRIIDYGNFKLGIGGIVTFKNAGLAEVVEQIDLKHLVLETDAPYLAPTPFRGKRNESTFLINIAEKIANIHQTNIELVAKITTKNSVEIFGF